MKYLGAVCAVVGMLSLHGCSSETIDTEKQFFAGEVALRDSSLVMIDCATGMMYQFMQTNALAMSDSTMYVEFYGWLGDSDFDVLRGIAVDSLLIADQGSRCDRTRLVAGVYHHLLRKSVREQLRLQPNYRYTHDRYDVEESSNDVRTMGEWHRADEGHLVLTPDAGGEKELFKLDYEEESITRTDGRDVTYKRVYL